MSRAVERVVHALSIANLVALMVIFSCSSAAHAEDTLPRVEIPINIRILPYGDVRYSIPIVLDGVTVDALLDTGSTGIRVLDKALPKAAIIGKSGRLEAIGYGEGDVLIGPIIQTPVKFGEASPTFNVPIQIVVKMGCETSKPNCPANLANPSEYQIGGEKVIDFGFEAIAGIEMPQAGRSIPMLSNPFLGIAKKWIVVLPTSDGKEGKLILNPSDSELAGFVKYSLDPKLKDSFGVLDNAIKGCLHVSGFEPFCAPITMDTGAPAFAAYSDNIVKPGIFENATPVELSFDDGKGSINSLQFQTEDYPAKRVVAMPLRVGEINRIEAGLLPYQYFAVLYDMTTNTIGLRPRKQPAIAATQ